MKPTWMCPRERGPRARRAARALALALPLVACSRGPSTSAEGRWFVQKGCSGCHSIAALGVAGRPTGAPDLSEAAEGVPRRYGVTLEEFLREPRSGTMSIVLSTQLRLTLEERREAARRLRGAFEVRREGGETRGRP